MSGLPPKPEFSQPPLRFEREEPDRHYRGSGGRSPPPPRRRARSPPILDSYIPGSSRGGGGRRTGPSSYRRSRSPPPRRERERLDTYRPSSDRDYERDYERERERERYDPREREWIPAAQSRRGERESWDARNAREKAERLAKEGRQASRRQRDWKTRDEAAAYDRRRERERVRSRSPPPRRRSYSRRPSPSVNSVSPQTQRSARARSPSREETPEEGAVTPEHRSKRRRSSSRSHSRSRSPRRSPSRSRSTVSTASRSRSPPIKKHRLPTSTSTSNLKHSSSSLAARLGPPPNKPAASYSNVPTGPAAFSADKPAESSSHTSRVPTPQPAPTTSKWPTAPSATTSAAPSPIIPSSTFRDKGKGREDRRDAEGDVQMTDSAPAIVVNTPTPTSTQPQSHALPARPIPTEPAQQRHNQTHPDRTWAHQPQDRSDPYKQQSSKPIPTAPAASSATHSKLPKGPKLRGTSPDPVAMKKRWEQRDMTKEQRERADKAAENERREYASYHTAMSAFHLKNPSTVSFELGRKLRQAAHELVVTLLDSGAAEKRRDVAEAGVERARAGVLGEGVMGSPVLQ